MNICTCKVFERMSLRWNDAVKSIIRLDGRPALLAAGFALGVLISFIPLYGFQSILAVTAAKLLRLHKLICLAGSLVNTPLTAIPLLNLSSRLGKLLLSLPQERLFHAGTLLEHWQDNAEALLIGTAITAASAFVIAYIAFYYVLVWLRRRQDNNSNHTKKELEAT